jgi:hypothetical protein
MTEKSAQGQVFITSPLDCQQDDGLVKRATALDVVHQ